MKLKENENMNSTNDEIMMEEEGMDGGDYGPYLYSEDGTVIDGQQIACPMDCGCWAIRYTGAILYADAVTICPDCGDVTEALDALLMERQTKEEEEE